METKMKFTRLLTASNGQSYFAEAEFSMQASAVGFISEAIPSMQASFGSITTVIEMDWHNTPCKQFIIMLKGNMEIEVSDGSKRIFYPGDILLLEDITGVGHRTRAASEGVREYLLIEIK